MITYLLPIHFMHKGQEQTLYPVLLKNASTMVLIDCGYEGQLPLIEEAAAKHDIDLHDLKGVIITHHDIDHMGGLYELKQKYPQVKIYTPVTEEPHVNGKHKSLRLIQAEKMFDELPNDHKPWAIEFQHQLASMKCVEVDESFDEEGTLPFMKDVISIHTPGHMPGHISLYIPSEKTLIAADAVVIENGELNIANPDFTLDIKQAIESVKKLSKLHINTLICYHGGMINTDIQMKLLKLSQSKF